MIAAGRRVLYDLLKKLREGREKSEITLKFLESFFRDFAGVERTIIRALTASKQIFYGIVVLPKKQA